MRLTYEKKKYSPESKEWRRVEGSKKVEKKYEETTGKRQKRVTAHARLRKLYGWNQ